MRKLILILILIGMCWFAADAARAAELKGPEQPVTAGTAVSLPTSGDGEATFILVGPGQAIKRQVQLGQPVEIRPEEVRNAGHYVAVLKGGSSDSAVDFYVTPAKADTINFLARPSRVPADTPNVISGVAFVFDAYHNLVLAPTPVKFSLSIGDAPGITRTVTSKNGASWTKLDSGKKAGAAQFVASVDDNPVRRVVQQTASDPCNLRMKAQRDKDGIAVETDPVRDCTGNPVPDGTIVTFTSVDSKGRSTVDARIKKGVAKAELPPSDDVTITVASGVVLGNEIHLGGGR